MSTQPSTATFKVLPAKPGTCVHCATEHDEHGPHNLWSLFYGTRFLQKWGRNPTHADCAAHLTPERRRAYRRVLGNMGIEWTLPTDGDPIREPYAESIG